jgi:hypothetical protein
MNFPPFWAKGTAGDISCWRWSNTNLSEAESLARAAAESLAARLKAGAKLQRRYGYDSGRPLREPVLRECKDESGELAAVITRNSYGCAVLNTAQMMFVDVDLPESRHSGGLGRWLKGLFGGAKPAPQSAPSPEETALVAKAEQVVVANPSWGWRIYRTRAGFRLLATHKLFPALAPEAEQIFDTLGADPLYRQLCKSQKCFRARLTPKPWRCNLSNPPSRWPWASAKAEKRFKDWEDRYLRACSNLATCKLIATIGNREVHPTIQPILAIHDQAVRAESGLGLA